MKSLRMRGDVAAMHIAVLCACACGGDGPTVTGPVPRVAGFYFWTSGETPGTLLISQDSAVADGIVKSVTWKPALRVTLTTYGSSALIASLSPVFPQYASVIPTLCGLHYPGLCDDGQTYSGTGTIDPAGHFAFSLSVGATGAQRWEFTGQQSGVTLSGMSEHSVATLNSVTSNLAASLTTSLIISGFPQAQATAIATQVAQTARGHIIQGAWTASP